MGKLIDLDAYPVRSTLKILLQDKTTKQNIIWATDAYKDAVGAVDTDQIQLSHLIGMDPILLQPRISKAAEEQQERTRKKAEVFTPRPTVKDMVDRLEQENPGCYDDPDKTFIDMYMKSGMYITEIVKRLYNSERMKRLFPDDAERLNHIFAKQVYGLAPTEIIYRICMAYIMGFSDEIKIEKHNIRLCDALEYAKAGTLDKKLQELFPELKR